MRGKSVKTFKKTVQSCANRVARLRDCGGVTGGANCISCNKWHPFGELDGGHFIPTTSSAVRFDLRNINAQCKKCNLYLSGNGRGYYRGMLNKYGQEVIDELESQEGVTKKWKLWELEEVYAKLKLKEAEWVV